VIPSFLMRLRSSRRYDPDRLAPQRARDEEHAIVDEADNVEPLFVCDASVVELNRVRVEKHLGGRTEVNAVLAAIGLFFRMIHSKSMTIPHREYTDYQYYAQVEAPCTIHSIVAPTVFTTSAHFSRSRCTVSLNCCRVS
jgi:hypothetical protein